MRYRSGEAIPFKAKAATVMSSSMAKRLIIVLGVRHCRGMERRKEGILIVVLLSNQMTVCEELLSVELW